MTSKLIHPSHEADNRGKTLAAHHHHNEPVSPSSSFFDDMDHHRPPSSPISQVARLVFAGSPSSSTDDEGNLFDSSDTESHDDDEHDQVEVHRPSLENQSVDYFSYKAQSYWPNKAIGPASSCDPDHLQVPSSSKPLPPPLGSYFSPISTPAPPPPAGSYFSPLNTPIPEQSAAIPPYSPPLTATSTRRSGLSNWQPNLAPTPEGDPFPYIAYESNYSREIIATRLPALRSVGPASTPLVPTSTLGPAVFVTSSSSPCRSIPPLSITNLAPPPPPSVVKSDEVIIKIYFANTSDLIKFRCRRNISLSDFVLTVAGRVPTGWEALHGAKDPVGWGAGVKDVERACTEEKDMMTKLSKDTQWSKWLEESLEGGVKRLILWAI
ncbi:hypothetical protein FRB95_008483 [Tulasnella sp. JGI-2019a]|nr:hypothetical protein FRB95_008483 [Tulasnella sp. JGI-2019a]